MEMGSNSGPGSGSGKEESGGSTTESSSLSKGLMFGQKIYFEDNGGGSRVVRGNGSGQSGQVPRCQVEGCGIDLTNVKSYYSRHKVCGTHSKTPKVIVSGLEQRFCQQCSRFHQLPEFDLEKRSCRRRLAGHNERRRKPQSASLSMLSSRYGRIAPSLYGNANTPINGSFLGNQETESINTSTMRQPPMSQPSWQIINPVMNVFNQESVGGCDSNCVLSLLSVSQDNNKNNNNTWPTSSSSFGPMTVTMAQPPPTPSQINDVTSMDEVELSDQHKNIRAYDDSSSHHTNWSL